MVKHSIPFHSTLGSAAKVLTIHSREALRIEVLASRLGSSRLCINDWTWNAIVARLSCLRLRSAFGVKVDGRHDGNRRAMCCCVVDCHDSKESGIDNDENSDRIQLAVDIEPSLPVSQEFSTHDNAVQPWDLKALVTCNQTQSDQKLAPPHLGKGTILSLIHI